MAERSDNSTEWEIIRASNGLNINYRRDLQKVVDQATELIVDTGGRTTNKALFQLAMHGMANGDVLDEDTTDAKYKKVDGFARRAVGRAMATVSVRSAFPAFNAIESMMYVPSYEGRTGVPGISYYLQKTNNHTFGRIDLAVAGMMRFTTDGQPVEPASAGHVPLATVRGAKPDERRPAEFHGNLDPYVVGLHSIYQQRPLNWQHPESGQIFDHVMHLAAKAFPDGTH